MTVRIKQHRSLYCDSRYYASFPAITQTGEGDLLVAFRRAPDARWMVNGDADLPLEADFDAIDHLHMRSHTALIRLGADLAVKEEAVMLPADGETADQDPGLLTLASGRILHYGFAFYPVLPEFFDRLSAQGAQPRRHKLWGVDYLFWGAYVRHSDDGGRQWSNRRYLPLGAGHGDDDKIAGRVFRGGPLRGRAVQLPCGAVRLAVYRPDPLGRGPEITQLYGSSTNGDNWHEVGSPVAVQNVHLREPALAKWPATEDGTLTAFHRTKGLDGGDLLVTATSWDGGQQFDAPIIHDFCGHPFDPLVLRDGRLLLLYGYRYENSGVRMRLIDQPDFSKGDRGQAIAEAISRSKEIILYEGNPGPDCGYPWACELDSGDIVVTYYKTYENGLKKGLRGIALMMLEVDKK